MTTSNIDIVFVVHKTSMHRSTQFKQSINFFKNSCLKLQLLVLKFSRFSKYGLAMHNNSNQVKPKMLPPILVVSLHNVNGSIVLCYELVKLISCDDRNNLGCDLNQR